MNANPAMTVANETILARAIRAAERRLVFVAPALGMKVASALAERWHALGPEKVNVVVDLDPEVYRLGYGQLEAVAALEKAAQEVGGMLTKQPGVRIGVLIADDETWVFAPTPALIEAGPRKTDAPNAVRLGLPPADLERDLGVGPDGEQSRSVGLDKADRASLEKVEKDLKDNPPQKFDVARQMRVFNTYFEFVDFRINQTQLNRKVVQLPVEFFGITNAANRQRLQTGFRLIDAGDELSGQELMKERSRIALKYLRHIPGFGAVIKRSDKPAFLEEVKQLREKVVTFQAKARNELVEVLRTRRDTLVLSLLPIVLKHPPEGWDFAELLEEGQPTEVRKFLERELDEAFGDVSRIVDSMRVIVNFKGVTYESLQDRAFMAKARHAFPELPALHEEGLAVEAFKPAPTKSQFFGEAA